MKCKGKTHDKRYPYQNRPCTRNEWKDGFCKTHHPEEKRKRNKNRMDKKEALYQESQKQFPIASGDGQGLDPYKVAIEVMTENRQLRLLLAEATGLTHGESIETYKKYLPIIKH